MRRTTSSFAAVVITGIIAGPLAASVIEFEELHANAFEMMLTPGVTTVSIPQFDDKNGTRELKEVSLLVNAALRASVTGENDASLSAPTFELGMSGFMTIDFGSLTTSLSFDDSFVTNGVAGSDGVAGSGPDFWDFGFVSVQKAGSDMTTNLSAFLGTGHLDAELVASGGFAITGTPESTFTVSDFKATGNVQIVYGYAQVPGPAGLALMATGLLVSRRRRR